MLPVTPTLHAHEVKEQKSTITDTACSSMRCERRKNNGGTRLHSQVNERSVPCWLLIDLCWKWLILLRVSSVKPTVGKKERKQKKT